MMNGKNISLSLRFVTVAKVRKLLSNRHNKKNIVQGVFNSVLCYCLPLFGGCNNSDVHVLQVQQNRAAQIVLNCPPRSNRNLMYDRLAWLTVQQLIAYHTLVTVYRIRQSQEPENLARILRLDNHNGHIIMKNTQLSLYRSSFVFRGSLLWNKLPRELRLEPKLSKFKKNLREWVLENIARFG